MMRTESAAPASECKQAPVRHPAAQTARGTIALFWPCGSLDRTPFVRSLPEALADAGFHVDVYTARNRYSTPPRVTHPRISVLTLPGEQKRERESVPWITACFLLWVLPKFHSRRYRFIIGTGIRGLFAGACISRLTGTPLIYHSVELYSSEDLTTLSWRIFKKLERWANRRASFTIIQDELRAEMLMRDNDVLRNRIELLPIAPVGGARPRRSHYLADRFQIAKGNKIVLYAGAFFEAFSVEFELIASSQSWPANWTLVLHSAKYLDPEQIAALRRADAGSRVVLSVEPLPYEELEQVIASADIGIALYKPSDENMYKIGWSSGKVGEYLRSGVPVIVSDFPMMRDLADRFGAGAAIHDFSELPAAVARIVDDLHNYRERAADCFDHVLAPENYLPKLLERIDREMPLQRAASA